MSNELIPRDSAREIIRQVFAAMNETLANQVSLSEQQLVQMMLFHFNKAYQEFVDAATR